MKAELGFTAVLLQLIKRKERASVLRRIVSFRGRVMGAVIDWLYPFLDGIRSDMIDTLVDPPICAFLYSFSGGIQLDFLSLLISGHLSLPPDSYYYCSLHLTQLVSTWYSQSVQPTSLFMERHWQLWWTISDHAGRKQGYALQAVFIKSKVVSRNVLDLHVHSPLTHWLRATSNPAKNTHGKCPILANTFIFYTIFYVPFILCLDMFWCTNTYHCVTIAYSFQFFNAVTFCTGL